MDNSQIAARIKNKCKEKRISINQLTKDCGFGKNLINDMETKNTSPSVVTQQTTVIPVNKFEELYPVIVGIIKSFWKNASIEFSEKNNSICLTVYDEEGLKLSRIRAYERENNKFDVAMYRQDGTTLRMLFFNNQDELDGILKSFSNEICV